MKIIFLGTPEFAIPSLNALINSHHQVLAVVTQIDKPKGRSGKLSFSPVKELAIKNNIPVLQYKKIRLEGVDELKSYNPDILVTCAYGQILSKEILELAPYGVINVHGSLLPKYRGASPIQTALINGETTTGITILKSEIGIDDGNTILSKSIDVLDVDDAKTLFIKLSVIGADCLIEALSLIENGKAIYTPQNHELATFCKFIKPEDAKIDFNNNASSIVNLIRGICVWPTAFINLSGMKIKVYSAKKADLQLNYLDYKNGQVVVSSNKQGLIVKCADGFVELIDILPENSKKMTAKSYLNGRKIEVGQVVE